MSRERVEELLREALPAPRLGVFAARDGLPERPLVAPNSREEATRVVDLARAEGWSILPLGSGSKLGWARAPARVDLVLSSRDLRGILAYEAADGTVTALAGTPWAEIVALTRERHHLSPELPDCGATLGGVLGAGASGLDRLRHGPLRHQVLGIQALQADGTHVKSGGRVVKNVTGYDLHRLWCGSHGTLSFFLEATLRLYPGPEASAVLRATPVPLATALAASHALWRSRVQPLAVVLTGRLEVLELSVVLAGRKEALSAEIDQARAILHPVEVLGGAEAMARREQLRQLELAGHEWPPLVLTCRPSRLASALAELEAACGSLGLVPELYCHPLLASVSARFPVPPTEQQVLHLMRALHAAEFDARWRRGEGRPPPRGSGSPASQLMLRLKQALDPRGVFASGRFDDAL